MKIFIRRALAFCLFSAVTLASAQGIGRLASGGFDTRYLSSDPLTNVIDDGKDTLISLPSRATKPIVRTVTPEGEVVLRAWLDHDSDVLVIQGLHKKLALSWSNGKSVEVVYTANRDLAPLSKTKADSIPKSEPTRLTSTEPRAKTVNGSPSSAAVLERITSQEIVDPVQSPVATPAPSWSVRVEDITLENTLKRWVQQSNHQLLWDTDREIQITAQDEFSGSFEDALNRVLQSPAIRQSEYPLEAVIYANNPPLVRITRLGEQ
jgi:Toxin co-regulated pilus biosynthesis protein Q